MQMPITPIPSTILTKVAYNSMSAQVSANDQIKQLLSMVISAMSIKLV